MTTPRRYRWTQLKVELALAVLLAGAGVGQAQEARREQASSEPPKPAWRWTLEERLAARFDPARMKARAAEAAVEREKAAKIFGERFDAADNQHSIDGRREPELFLPTELFETLLSWGFPLDSENQAEQRETIEERAVVLGFGRDLWGRLERASLPYLQIRQQRHRRAMAALARSELFEDTEVEATLACQARAKALAAAKAEFGEETFLRFLYEVMTPSLSFDYLVEEDTVEHLRTMEGGC